MAYESPYSPRNQCLLCQHHPPPCYYSRVQNPDYCHQYFNELPFSGAESHLFPAFFGLQMWYTSMEFAERGQPSPCYTWDWTEAEIYEAYDYAGFSGVQNNQPEWNHWFNDQAEREQPRSFRSAAGTFGRQMENKPAMQRESLACRQPFNKAGTTIKNVTAIQQYHRSEMRWSLQRYSV